LYCTTPYTLYNITECFVLNQCTLLHAFGQRCCRLPIVALVITSSLPFQIRSHKILLSLSAMGGVAVVHIAPQVIYFYSPRTFRKFVKFAVRVCKSELDLALIYWIYDLDSRIIDDKTLSFLHSNFPSFEF
jgi:hypothetical protein